MKRIALAIFTTAALVAAGASTSAPSADTRLNAPGTGKPTRAALQPVAAQPASPASAPRSKLAAASLAVKHPALSWDWRRWLGVDDDDSEDCAWELDCIE